eukprot:13129391-Heterocapsa_arctica.AAC.1
MNKAKQIQAHKRDKHTKAHNILTQDMDFGDTINAHGVEDRRQQYQGYLDQKEDRTKGEEHR